MHIYVVVILNNPYKFTVYDYNLEKVTLHYKMYTIKRNYGWRKNVKKM